MDSYIDGRLIHWAEQVRDGMMFGKLVSNGSTIAGMIKSGVPVRSTKGPELLVDQAAEEMDHCVTHLPEHLKQAVLEKYLQDNSVEQKARACGCSVRGYHMRIERAHSVISAMLDGNK